MGSRHNQDKSSDEAMTKRRSAQNAQSKTKRKATNDKVNASLKGMYDDVVNEPVPDGMMDFDNPARKPEG